MLANPPQRSGAGTPDRPSAQSESASVPPLPSGAGNSTSITTHLKYGYHPGRARPAGKDDQASTVVPTSHTGTHGPQHGNPRRQYVIHDENVASGVGPGEGPQGTGQPQATTRDSLHHT